MAFLNRVHKRIDGFISKYIIELTPQQKEKALKELRDLIVDIVSESVKKTIDEKIKEKVG